MEKKFEKTSKSFELQLGFNSCELNPNKEIKDNELFIRNMEKLVGKCENIKGDKYHCITYLDPNSIKITKYNCDMEE
ncbi:MAG: hypothetical protein ACFFKA_10990 [Candidatus Thorarchaeota archaeon]